jgi:flagellar hook-length control protein FliK
MNAPGTSPQAFIPVKEFNSASAIQVQAPVTLGSMAQPRMTRDTLTNVTQSIVGLSQGPNGRGGEIRIRLKPENLGELHLKIATRGDQVGLQIHASTAEARKVLEESVASLRESLSAQNLNLSKIDIAVNPSAFSQDQSGGNKEQNPNAQTLAQNMNMQQGNDSRGQQRMRAYQDDDSRESGRGGRVASFSGAGAVSRAATDRSQRVREDGSIGLDVVA